MINHIMRLQNLLAVVLLLILGACGRTPQDSKIDMRADEWHPFEGTWTAAGTRDSVQMEGERRASIATFEGSLVLAGASRPTVGFRAEAIVFNDSATGLTGRAVWTDEKGEKVYSELTRSGTATDEKIKGTFTGGTGRYEGVTGSYEFSWLFQIESEEGIVQGQSVGLTGKFRVGAPRRAVRMGGPQA